jgi:prepilin-type N-terminal cleavage/methylation domain-containing protein
VLRLGGSGRRDGSGFSLIEMLVASAVFAIAAAVAFILYSAAQKSYKSGENFTDQQQATRVAFDRMISDIRLAGFNYNPDGDTTRIDEQIEGAWDTAVTVRGDFDFEDPAASVSPESALPGTSYDVVSTGNDEIVTYALAKPGPTGPATLTLRLDPDKPRSKTLDTVIVPNVAVVHDNPPYTLYRITLADVAGGFPASPQAASNFVFEPVADNIRSMSFLYYDDQGTMLGPNTPANVADDIGGLEGASLTRSRIRRIAVNLVGMTQDEDLAFTDSDAVAAVQHYRKFDLQSDVNPENLGKTGIKDLDTSPPPVPTNISLVPGHCQGILVKWDAPSSSAGVASNTVKYWPSGSPTSAVTQGFNYPHVEYGVVDYDGHAFVSNLTMGSSYCFQVNAKDGSSNQSQFAPSTAPCATVTNASTPGTPQNLQATGGGSLSPLDSQIKVTWNEVQSNTGTVTGDPDTIGGNTILRDTKGYKLYRDTVAIYTPNDSLNMVANTTVLGVGSTQFLDTLVANCRNYYYKLVVLDKCDVSSAVSATATGRAETLILPAKPTGLSGNRTNPTNIVLSWTAVSTNVNGGYAFIDLYKVYRAKAPTGTPVANVSSASYVLRGTSSTTTYTDSVNGQDHQDLNNGYSFYYVVSAADLCGNESQRSDPIEVFCDFGGSLITTPANNGSGGSPVEMALQVSGGDPIVRARVRIPSLSSPGTDAYMQEIIPPSPCSSCLFDFEPDWSPGTAAGTYTIYWEVETNRGCVKTITTTFDATATLSCQITPTNPNLSPTTGKPSSQNKKLSWDLVNNSGSILDIFKFELSWTNVLGSHINTTLEYPTGTAPFGCTKSASTSSNATWDCSFALGLGASQTINMSLVWDTQIVNSSNVGENVTIKYHFRDATSTAGFCSFTVKPDLTIQ